MATQVKPIPEGYHTITPYLTVHNAANMIQFLKQGLGAEISHEPLKRPDGKVAHAEVKIGDSRVMLGEENEMAKASPSTLYVYVPDVDVAYKKAIKAGGKSVAEPTDMFYGDRCGAVKDPSGNTWSIATHQEDLTAAELAKRAESFYKKQKGTAA